MRRTRLHRPGRIDILKRRELAYWTARLGVTVEELRMAVLKVGPRCERVAAELGKTP